MTAYHALDRDAQGKLLTALRDTSWSWKEVDVPAVVTRLDWEIAKLTPTFSATVDPGHGLGDRAYRFSFRDGRVSRSSVTAPWHDGCSLPRPEALTGPRAA